ncbi:MAG: DUF6046 domain-containing protein [Bacteroidales bacterium]|jgi:hypothetical protein|nr:DUF6046 domain-containing protein [Bacteroidales bacterium]
MAIYINQAMGFRLPPYWLQNKDVVRRLQNDKIDEAKIGELLGVPHYDAFEIKWEDEPDTLWWQLPLDPVVSVSCKNNIIRRSVMKQSDNGRGTVKELWSRDDYEITIAGVFIGNDEFPETSLRELRKYCESRRIIEVKSKLLTLFGITRMVIEDYSLPFTKGLENQMYTIRGYSDDMFDLLEKDNQ